MINSSSFTDGTEGSGKGKIKAKKNKGNRLFLPVRILQRERESEGRERELERRLTRFPDFKGNLLIGTEHQLKTTEK